MLSTEVCQRARLSRDPRFDGKFFVAVKTTKIYCRPICPATTPREENLTYYSTAIEAANEGFRPCLRCRPDSAPNSPAWKGVNTTLDRATRLIDEGALQEGSIEDLASRLGIGGRYLRQLFKEYLGISPKAYALYQQCLFAKNLLHQTDLPITQVALASGFKSIRRFNDCFQSQLKLTPSQVRKSRKSGSRALTIQLYYRPPYDWAFMNRFLSDRTIVNLEWVDEQSYGRTFEVNGTRGTFTAEHIAKRNCFDVTIEISDLKHLKTVIYNIRRILDLDVDMQMVEKNLYSQLPKQILVKRGLRLPGIWTMFEAGIRAILGQQISIQAACKLVRILTDELGEPFDQKVIFPSPKSIAASDLKFLKMPGKRRQTLRNLAQHYLDSSTPDNPDEWLRLKGIGPWTVNYARMRGLSDPDIFLAGDLHIDNMVAKTLTNMNPETVSPWRSYLTFQLWSQV